MKKAFSLLFVVTAGLLCAAVTPAKAPVEETWRLAAVVALPSFAEFSRAAGRLGVALRNPILPALLVSSQQERLKQRYARPRPQAAIWSFEYVHPKNDRVSVTVYPMSDRAGTFLLDHAGSERQDDGTIRLPPSDACEHVQYVLYSKTGDWAAFAPTPEFAKRGLDDFLARDDRDDPSVNLRFFLTRAAFARMPADDALRAFQSASGDVVLNDKGLMLQATLVPCAGKKANLTLLGAVRSALKDELPAKAVDEAITRLESAEKETPISPEFLAQVLPESASGVKPADVFCRSLYDHVRSTVIPRMRQTAKGNALRQLDGLRKAMPASEKGAAVAGCLWQRANGTCRVLIRINNAELANYGKAFNAFTASSLAVDSASAQKTK